MPRTFNVFLPSFTLGAAAPFILLAFMFCLLSVIFIGPAHSASACTIPRIAAEYEKIKSQLAQCEKNDALPFCEDAEDYEPLLKPDEANAAWACLTKLGALKSGFPASTGIAAKAFTDWKVYSKRPYLSGHLNRFTNPDALQAIYVQNFANAAGENYGKFEKAGTMPEGAVLAKYSIVLDAEGGQISLAPAYFMTKLKHGSRKKSGDWHYDMIWPATVDLDKVSADKSFTQDICLGCHEEFGRKSDHMLLMPEEVRVISK